MGLSVLAHAKGATSSRTTAGQGDVERSVRAGRSNTVGPGVLTWRVKPDAGAWGPTLPQSHRVGLGVAVAVVTAAFPSPPRASANAGCLATAVSWWEEGVRRWSAVVCGRVLLGVASTHFAAVGTEAGVLHVFSPYGRLLTAPIGALVPACTTSPSPVRLSRMTSVGLTRGLLPPISSGRHPCVHGRALVPA